MAQRFIIDGNFTQSLGNINLNLNACPAESEIIYNYVVYDETTGALCYRKISR